VSHLCAAVDDLGTGGGASALQELISHHDGGRGAGRQVSRRAPDKCAPSPPQATRRFSMPLMQNLALRA